MSLEVEINALKSDAKAWDQAATDMDGPIQGIAPLTLNGADDVMGLGERLGIDDSYEQARSKMAELMGQAIEYFGAMSTALTDVATNYEQMEQAGHARFSSQEGNLPGGN